MAFMTVTEMAAQLRSGQATSVGLTEAAIAAADRLDAALGTYVSRFDDYALSRAARADDDFKAGVDRGPLQGVPMGIKDILATAHGGTTANSLVLDPTWGAGRRGPVVARLENAGAVIVGKTITSEFAIGDPDPSKPFPIPHNPWDLSRSPGGSSAGTGNGVAAGLFPAGIGTDTAGSIRIPAAWNGITGLMPTFGRVPKSGCVPLGYSLDHVGPMAHTARDCAEILSVIAGFDPSDESCASRPVEDYAAGLSGHLEGLRIGVDIANHFPDGSDPALAPCFEAALNELVSMGATLVEVVLPNYSEVVFACNLMWAAEALAYHRADLQERWADYYALSRVKIALGTMASAADYVQAARVRRLAQRSLRDLFDQVDLVAGPTAAIAAPTPDTLAADRTEEIWNKFCFTSYWNATGNPAIAIPMGFNSAGLPLSLQLAGRPFDEGLLLKAGDAYQSSTDWHRREPPPAMAEVTASLPAPA